MDFLVKNKIVIELKTKPSLGDKDIRQLLAYLQAAKIKLDILVNFRPRRLAYKRIVNPKVKLL